VNFTDGRAEAFDGSVGTGFDLRLPFLSDDIAAILTSIWCIWTRNATRSIPTFLGLAFMGMFDQSGGYFVPLELQARWIAYTWAA